MENEKVTFHARVVLVHAVRAAMAPIHEALARLWPNAEFHDLLDSSLSADRAAGCDARSMTPRFLTLARYAAGTQSPQNRTAGVLFTCSAFGPQIEAVQRELTIPVVKPNEGAFMEALAAGDRIGLLVTFHPALDPLVTELRELAAKSGRQLSIDARHVDGALPALQAGDVETHDGLVAAAARELRDVSTVVLGQFSMARAAPRVAKAVAAPVITTPDAAVRQLRDRVRMCAGQT